MGAGQFYGGEYQSLSEEQREEILIDGQPTCEVDYKACHIRMLYNKKGFDYNGDPYELDGYEPAMRVYVKKMFQMLINNDNMNRAIQAYKYFVHKLPDISEGYKSELINNAKELTQRMLDKHQAIGEYLLTEIGIRLQFKDSQIAERILKHFTKKGIVCLCIHDSFIVPKQHRDELIEMMRRAYKSEMKFNCELK